MESYEKLSRRSWRPRVAGCWKTKTKNRAESRRKGGEEEPKEGRPHVEGGKKDDCTTRWW